jgi:hypothetical protein
MNELSNQFANKNFTGTAEKLLQANYELAGQLYAQQLQLAREVAKSGAKHLQQFQNAKNATDLLNAQSECWTSSIDTFFNGFQSTLEIANRTGKLYSEMLGKETPKPTPTVRRARTVKKTAKKRTGRSTKA